MPSQNQGPLLHAPVLASCGGDLADSPFSHLWHHPWAWEPRGPGRARHARVLPRSVSLALGAPSGVWLVESPALSPKASSCLLPRDRPCSCAPCPLPPPFLCLRSWDRCWEVEQSPAQFLPLQEVLQPGGTLPTRDPVLSRLDLRLKTESENARGVGFQNRLWTGLLRLQSLLRTEQASPGRF